MAKPLDEYKKRVEQYSAALKDLGKKLSLISNLRLLTALSGMGAAIYLYFRDQRQAAAIISAAALALFIGLVTVHVHVRNRKAEIGILVGINEDSIRRLTGRWREFTDTGTEFSDDGHPYTGDLDIFGQGSLFQWINTAVTFKGRKALSEWLSAPCTDDAMIASRQRAARELSRLLDFRQRFQAAALRQKESFTDPEPLFEWAEQRNELYLKRPFIWLIRILPAAAVITTAAAFAGIVHFIVPAAIVLLQTGLLAIRFLETNRILAGLGPFARSIGAYRRMLEAFEAESFEDRYLRELQGRLLSTAGKRAGDQMRELERIVDRAAVRHSQLYLVVNILLLWDYQCMAALEKWKELSGTLLRQWLAVLGELEALCSLAVLYFDHPEWTVPVIDNEETGILAAGLGHPLLPEDRVCNDLSMRGRGRVYLITGSNMSGKSTWLRTAGINLVLAYAGAPVCAREFRCSLFRIYTSMRVRDDLEKNISSFYAELLRIKRMIDAARTGEQVFFLLDEIFKGTNSRDRHTGARLLIRQLSREGAVGLVSTHDVELGDLADENENIENYHFKEYYREGQLCFDYKLHPGISNTRNAIYLMKMAGVMVPEGEDQQVRPEMD
ncbi:MAG TPA: DNA mismatch repair protein MutS [Candidatus Atribacteria bacterium]|nr:DNA mismatch repair protein MutS [Candidatus Atribacteria bacterium]HPT78144.1 DNA mismatch repair protein MutS [Candidatus Atribacteria bacterium]